MHVLIDLNNTDKQNYIKKTIAMKANPIYAAIGIKTVNPAVFRSEKSLTFTL